MTKAQKEQADLVAWYMTARPAAVATPGNSSVLNKWKSRGGILGGIASFLLLLGKFFFPILVFLSKFKMLLILGKVLLTGSSMLISMWFWSQLFGWPFAVGLVLLIFIHESGHALAARMRGSPLGIMVFIPFMGAFVSHRGGRTVVEDAFIGIMGPVFGTLAGLGCLAIYFFGDRNPFWLALAQVDFMINLFNLAPTAPLDGGWIVPVFSPRALAFGSVLMLLMAFLNPLILVLFILSLPRVIAGWKSKGADMPYFKATAAQRWMFGFAYIGLVVVLGVLMAAMQVMLHSVPLFRPH